MSKLSTYDQGYWNTELFRSTNEFHMSQNPMVGQGTSNLPNKSMSGSKRWSLAEEQKKKQSTSIGVGVSTSTLHQNLGINSFEESIFHKAQDGNAEQQMSKLKDKLFVEKGDKRHWGGHDEVQLTEQVTFAGWTTTD